MRRATNSTSSKPPSTQVTFLINKFRVLIDVIIQELVDRDEFLGPKLKTHFTVVECYDDDYEDYVELHSDYYPPMDSEPDIWLKFIKRYDEEHDCVYN